MVFCSQHAEIPDNCEKAADSSDAEYDDDFEEYDSSEVSKGTLYLPYILFLKKNFEIQYLYLYYWIHFNFYANKILKSFFTVKFGLKVQQDIEFNICW